MLRSRHATEQLRPRPRLPARQHNSPSFRIEYRGRRRRSGTSKRKEASEQLGKLIDDVLKGAAPVKRSKVTVASLLDLVKRDYKLCGTKNLRNLEQSYIPHLTAFFRNVVATSIRTEALEAYAESRLRAGRAGATINREFAALKRVYSLALERKLLAAKPKFPRLPEAMPQQGFFEDQEWLKVRDELPEPARSIATYACWTGSRLSEILSLRWEHVGLNRGVVRFPPETKNGEPRIIPLASELVALLTFPRTERDTLWPHSPWVLSRSGEQVRSIRKG